MTPHALHSRALKNLLKRVLKLLDPPPSLNVWKWGELRRRMGKNVTAKPGRYSVATTPFQKEPQESFTDKDVQTTVLYWAKRLGKTEMLNNLHGSVIEQSPRGILHVMPTLDSAKKWSKQFFAPMVRSVAILRRMIRFGRTRESNNTILSKEFPGGTISAIGANSPSGFRQVQAPVVTCDEIDAMENGPEGDPVTLAFGRAENYPDSIQIVSSTATIKQTSRIHAWYEKSDQRKWFVPCGCGQWHVLSWSGVKWPKFEDGSHDTEKAYYETPCCGAKWNDYDRSKAIIAGEWRPTAKFSGIRGYWLNGLNTTFEPKKGYKSKLHQFAAEFLDAYTSGEAARISWKNTFLCEPHEEIAERIESSPLLERCEFYTPQTLPSEIAVIGCTVDVQGDRLELDMIGMGTDEETWGIEFVKIFGDPEKEEVWADLRNHLAKKYIRADGVELPITCTAIDLGHKPKRVREFIKRCGIPRVYGVYGTSGKQVNLVVPRQNKHYRMFSYAVNTNGAKDILFARLKLKDAGARYLHWPKDCGYDKAYFDGLTAEESRLRYTHGFPERYYEKIRDRNEPLDLRVYFLAAMDILKPNIKAIQENLLSAASFQRDYYLKNPDDAAENKPVILPAPVRRIARKQQGAWR